MGIDDVSSHPEVCSEVVGGVTRSKVCLFREPDAGNLPVRFDEREQETELRQTGLSRVTRKHPNSHREANATAPVLDSTRHCTHRRPEGFWKCYGLIASVKPNNAVYLSRNAIS
jgi:hypothetical protein